MAVNSKKEFGNNRTRKPDISTMVYGKVPPQVPEMEEAVLGAILLEKDKLEDVMEIIQSPECFYVDAHQKIYAAILRVLENGFPVDLLTVTEELRKSDELELIGGAYYITRLTMAVVSSAHVEAHARIVVEKHMQRQMIRIAGQAISEAYEDGTDVFDLIDHVETEVLNIQQATTRQVEHISKVALETTKTVLEQRHNKTNTNGVRSGFYHIDKATNGWQKTDLIILAARPSVGKTALSLNIAMNASGMFKDKPTDIAYPTAFFSLEMSKTQLCKRLQSAISGVDLTKINNPATMTDEEEKRYQESAQVLSRAPLFIDETPGLTSYQLRSKARKLKKKHGIELIIIDYLQLMVGKKTEKGNREQEVSQISRDVKQLAKELDIPIIALSQLNRSVENRKDNRPNLSDLRESGAIEQDADVIAFLYSPSDEEIKRKPSLEGFAYFDIKKHRNGQTVHLALYFEKRIQKWHNDKPFEIPVQEMANEHYKVVSFSKLQSSESKDNEDQELPF